MLNYPAGLLATIDEAPGKEYHIKQEDLETVLQFLEKFAVYPKPARELVEYIANKKKFHTTRWVLSTTKRQCLDHPAADEITASFHAYSYVTDPAEEGSKPIKLFARLLLKLEAGLQVKELIAANLAI